MTARLGLIALTALALLSACGLSGEQQARPIDDVEYDLLSTSTSTTSTTEPVQPRFDVLFFWHTAGNNSLRIIERGRDAPPSAGQTLQELTEGPSVEELAANPDLQSQLDPSMEPVLFLLDDGTHQIQIQNLAEEALTAEQAAEFVCTATQFPEIDAITIVDAEGTAFSLSGAGAVPIQGAARASDFNDCVEDPILGEVDPADADGDDGEADGDDGEADGAETTTTASN